MTWPLFLFLLTSSCATLHLSDWHFFPVRQSLRKPFLPQCLFFFLGMLLPNSGFFMSLASSLPLVLLLVSTMSQDFSVILLQYIVVFCNGICNDL